MLIDIVDEDLIDKLKQMWFTKPSDERPTYLEQDLKELDSC